MNAENSAAPERLVLRNTTRWVVAGAYLSLAAIGVAAAILADGVPQMIFFVLAAVIFTVLGVRGARSAIWISDAGVTARADRFTRHLTWTEIDRFEIRPRLMRGLVPGPGLGAWTREGRWVRLMDNGLDRENQYGAALRVLEAEVAHRR